MKSEHHADNWGICRNGKCIVLLARPIHIIAIYEYVVQFRQTFTILPEEATRRFDIFWVVPSFNLIVIEEAPTATK